MRKHYQELIDYVHKMEDNYGPVTLMDKFEKSYMHKLSKPCYRNEYANLNQYEIAVINQYLKGDINVRQLAYYLGGVTEAKAEHKAQLYKAGRYEFTNHRNYWELKRK